MRRIIILFVVSIILLSCGSGIYELNEIESKKEDANVKYFELNEFDIYAFAICEDIKKEVNNKRFCNCPYNFHQLPEKDSIIKVEETYLLRHKLSNMVLYLTTVSHKYLRLKSGFLNDSSTFKDKIVLDEIEYAYIGNSDISNNWIHFPNQKGGKDIVLHFDGDKFPESLLIKEANIATAENKYSTDYTIPLDSVFREPLEFNKVRYMPEFYKGNIKDGVSYQPKCINIISRTGKVEIVFGCIGIDDYYYKISNKKIRYNTNFFLLPKQLNKL